MNDSVNVHKAYIRSENPINPNNNPCLAIDMIYPWTLEIIENFQLHIFARHQDGIRKYFSIISEMSKDYFNRCKYIKASKYGAYAKGTAMGGIISMIIVLLLIAAQLIHYHMKFYY